MPRSRGSGREGRVVFVLAMQTERESAGGRGDAAAAAAAAQPPPPTPPPPKPPPPKPPPSPNPRSFKCKRGACPPWFLGRFNELAELAGEVWVPNVEREGYTAEV